MYSMSYVLSWYTAVCCYVPYPQGRRPAFRRFIVPGIVIVYRIVETIIETPNSARFDIYRYIYIYVYIPSIYVNIFIERHIESFDTISNTKVSTKSRFINCDETGIGCSKIWHLTPRYCLWTTLRYVVRAILRAFMSNGKHPCFG